MEFINHKIFIYLIINNIIDVFGYSSSRTQVI